MNPCCQITRTAIPFFVSITLLATWGCGKGDIERATVSGAVLLDGKPLSSGQIRFVPFGSSTGPAWTAWINNGRYTTEGTKGAAVGELRVEILAYRVAPEFATRATATSTGEDEGDLPKEQYLPPKYNVQSKLRMTIEPGSGRVEKNFELSLR